MRTSATFLSLSFLCVVESYSLVLLRKFICCSGFFWEAFSTIDSRSFSAAAHTHTLSPFLLFFGILFVSQWMIFFSFEFQTNFCIYIYSTCQIYLVRLVFNIIFPFLPILYCSYFAFVPSNFFSFEKKNENFCNPLRVFCCLSVTLIFICSFFSIECDVRGGALQKKKNKNLP